MSEGRARFAREGGHWFLKLSGDLRHPLGPALDALLDRALGEPGYAGFLIDLTEAENIDSTCLGILARIAIHASRSGRARPIVLWAGEDIAEVLTAVCFDRIFNLVNAAEAPQAAGEGLAPIPEVSAAEGPLLALVLEAHRRLCALDARNQAAFSDVVQALEQEAGQRSRDGSD